MKQSFEWSLEHKGQCPFKKLNKRFQLTTKGSITKVLADKQTVKHKEYVDILKRVFQQNEAYFTNIQSHIKNEDLIEFGSMREDIALRSKFFDTKLKEYFWNGFWLDGDNLTSAERSFQKIGNLGLEDVTAIVEVVLSQHGSNIEEIVWKIEEEIDIRLKNNVLIDAILHLDDFPHTLIIDDKEQTSAIVLWMIQDNVSKDGDRFSPTLIPEIFREPMMADGMIDEQGVVPQLTFGCPIINLHSGRVFKLFVIQFVRCFFFQYNASH
jgi:hypothetical protein